jgi:hypothetical protein
MLAARTVHLVGTLADLYPEDRTHESIPMPVGRLSGPANPAIQIGWYRLLWPYPFLAACSYRRITQR